MPLRDSNVVKKLRAAGVVIIGKTSMAEWADARAGGNGTVGGWSAYGGQVYGAYCNKQDPMGSSSGGGVGVSIGLAAAALGTGVSHISLPSGKITSKYGSAVSNNMSRIWAASSNPVHKTRSSVSSPH
jgi:hypothetical protein